MAGRRPKPLALHQFNGNPSHLSQADLKGADNPNPNRIAPEMPKNLPKEARREWRVIVPILLRLGVLNETNKAALMGYVRSFAEVEINYRDMVKNGRTFVTHFEDKEGNLIVGDIKVNPSSALYNAAMKQLKSFLIEFGLTPAALSRLKIERPSAETDKMEQFLKKRVSQSPFVVKPESVV